MITRPLTDRSDSTLAPLTEDQLATIGERQAHAREVVSIALTDPLAGVFLQGERHSRGWAGRNRLLGMLKVAIVDEGRTLLSPTLWRVYEYELHVPWEVHYWDAVVGRPDHFDLAFHVDGIPHYDRDFYRTVAPGHQTKEQLRYSQGHWLPTLVPGIPSIAEVGDDEALHFLGYAGIVLDAEHPTAPPDHPALGLDEHSISVIVGTAMNIILQAHGGLGPYVYEKVSIGTDYLSVSEDGTVLAIVPSDTATGIVSVDVRVTDVFGTSVDAVLTVNIEPLPRE